MVHLARAGGDMVIWWVNRTLPIPSQSPAQDVFVQCLARPAAHLLIYLSTRLGINL